MKNVYSCLSTLVDASIARRIAFAVWPEIDSWRILRLMVGTDLRSIGVLSKIRLYSGWDVLQSGMQLDDRLIFLKQLNTASALLDQVAQDIENLEMDEADLDIDELVAQAVQDATDRVSRSEVFVVVDLLRGVHRSILREIRILEALDREAMPYLSEEPLRLRARILEFRSVADPYSDPEEIGLR